MKFDSFAAFLEMGGHGEFVWLAYGITLVVLGLNWFWPKWALREWLADAKILLRRDNPEGSS